jgi:glutamate-5-semialdehyde dehydrogenase
MSSSLNVLECARAAKTAALRMANVSSGVRNKAILAISEEMARQKAQIEEVNSRDVSDASKNNLSLPLIKRLRLDDSKIGDLRKGLELLAQLEDPVGKTLYSAELDHGLELYKVTCPIGVIGAIFESRPDVLVQISTLCLKSGNAVILKGGTETARTNLFLTGLIRKTIGRLEIPEDSVQLVETRDDVSELLKLDEYVDLLVPRGSSSLVKYVKSNSKIPVLGHAEGICHEYVDAEADLEMAVDICYDAKVQYPAVCNAMNALLVHRDVAPAFLPRMNERYEEAHVELRGDERTRKILPRTKEASERDWSTEYLDLILNIRVVDSLEQAIVHINRYSSHHTDGIVTENEGKARKFLSEVDSSVVVHNASTRFSDGYRFGFGAEVGISTGKIHSRGPVGLDGLVTYKYIVAGTGQVVSSYVGERAKPFTHRALNKSWNM